MRDTIYSIDTVYIQNKLDSISQLDMGQHINIIHSSYDSYMTIILWILGIAFGFIGLGIPLFQFFINRKSEKVIKTAIEGIDEKIKVKVNEEVNSELEEQIKKYRLEFDDRLKTSIDEIKNESDFSLELINSNYNISRGDLYNAIAKVLRAAEICIDRKMKEKYSAILLHLSHIRTIVQNKEIINTNLMKDSYIKEYLSTLKTNAGDDEHTITLTNLIETRVNEIIEINKANSVGNKKANKSEKD